MLKSGLYEQDPALQDTVHAPCAMLTKIRPVHIHCTNLTFTGAVHEPLMFSRLKKEILSRNTKEEK